MTGQDYESTIALVLRIRICWQNERRAGVAQLVESQLPKLVVASSNLVARSID